VRKRLLQALESNWHLLLHSDFASCSSCVCCLRCYRYYCYYNHSITLLLPTGKTVQHLLSELQEQLQLQLLEHGGASPLQLRVLLQDGSKLTELLASSDKLKPSRYSVYSRDDLLKKGWYDRQEGRQRLLLEAVPQVNSCAAYE
jgi:hypothetical protein